MRGIITRAWILSVGLLAGCAELPDIEAGICGNRVLESGEECDGPDERGFACRGSEQSNPCRYDCSGGQACRPGYLCSASDGVCRAPSGGFDPEVELVSRGALHLRSADMDGDARTDIVAVSPTGISVHYVEGSGRVASSFEIPALPSLPVIGKISDDDINDLVLNAQEGISLMRGRADRTFDPTIYSTIPLPPGHTRLVSVDALGGSPDLEVLLFAEPVGADGAKIRGSSVAEQGNITELFTFPATHGVLEGEVAVGWFSPGRPCPAVAMAFKDRNDFQVLHPCNMDSAWNEEMPASDLHQIPLPDGRVTWGGVFAANIDDEPVLMEIAVGTRDPLTDEKRLDLFRYSPVDPAMPFIPTGVSIPVLAKADFCTLSDEPLPALVEGSFKIADLNQDGRADFFDTYGGLFSREDGTYSRDACPGEAKWDSLLVGHFNLDGYPDLAVVPPARNFLMVYIGTPSGVFNVFVYPMGSEVKGIRAGDFDGDVITDIAVWEAGSGTAELSILFSRTAGEPEDPVQIGELEGIREVVVARSIGEDGIDDLAVVSGSSAPTLAILPGNTARQIQSPFLFYTAYPGPGPGPGIPVRSRPERIAGLKAMGDERDDILVLAEEVEPDTGKEVTRFWMTQAVNQFDFAPMEIDGVPDLRSTNQPLLSLAPLNMNAAASSGTDPDEVVAFSRSQAGVDQMLRVSYAGDAYSFEAEELTGLSPLLLDQIGLEPEVPMAIEDIDGDGLQDVALTTEAGELVVFWNEQGDNAFTAGNRTVMPLPFAVSWIENGAGIVDMVFLELNGAPPLELACLMPDGIQIVELLAADLAALLSPGTGRRPPPGAEASSITSISATGLSLLALDVDGDGLTDLVIGGQDKISLLRSTQKAP